jgi:hypothetical protein
MDESLFNYLKNASKTSTFRAKARPSIERRSFTCIFQFISALKIESLKLKGLIIYRSSLRTKRTTFERNRMLFCYLKKKENLTELIS